MRVAFASGILATVVVMLSTAVSADTVYLQGRWCRALDRTQKDFSIRCLPDVKITDENACKCPPNFMLYNDADFPKVGSGNPPQLHPASDDETHASN